MAIAEWSLPVLVSTHEPFIVFFLPCPGEEGSDGAALVGTWPPTRLNHDKGWKHSHGGMWSSEHRCYNAIWDSLRYLSCLYGQLQQGICGRLSPLSRCCWRSAGITQNVSRGSCVWRA